MTWALLALIGLIGWLACGLLSAGFRLSYLQYRRPLIAEEQFIQHTIEAKFSILWGPVDLITTLCLKQTGYGLLYHRPTELHDCVKIIKHDVLKGKRPIYDLCRMEELCSKHKRR